MMGDCKITWAHLRDLLPAARSAFYHRDAFQIAIAVPYRQGALDGLCGVYAVVNAARLMFPGLPAEPLFAALIAALPDPAAAITHGTSATTFHSLIRAANVHLAPHGGWRVQCPFSRTAPLAGVWQRLDRQTRKHGAGSVLIGLEGAYYHWTCLRRVAATHLDLADSHTLHRIARTEATTSQPTARRIHRLSPAHIYFLRRPPQTNCIPLRRPANR